LKRTGREGRGLRRERGPSGDRARNRQFDEFVSREWVVRELGRSNKGRAGPGIVRM
jgi:hypothetical protein